MAGYGRARAHVGRGIALILINLALALGILVWFDYLGIIDAKVVLNPVYRLLRIPVRRPGADADALALLDEDRAAKQMEALLVRSQELDKAQADLERREREINQMAQELDERQQALDDQEKSFNEKLQAAEIRTVNIEQNARRLAAMPPEAAVKILEAMEDQDIIDHLRAVERIAAQAGEDSLVPYWVSKMDPVRAATIQRKMTIKPVTLD